MLRSLHYSARLFRIGWVLARHDALFGLRTLKVAPLTLGIANFIPKKHRGLRPGQRLSLALQALGPTYIKLGQALSTRPDLVSDDIARDLSELQDRLPPFPTKIARATVEEQLGKPIGELFQSFDETAVATASIAQVHFAVTHAGSAVAVKILRPNVEAAFERDIELFTWIAEKIERRLPKFRRLKPVAAIATFASTVRMETDLRFEAAAADELRENSKSDPDFYVPKVEWDLTAKRVLTTEKITGFHAGDVEGLRGAGIDLNATMEKAARAFFNQVFRDGFFHADMHPGNLFVLPDGRLAPVDFGIMGRIDRATQLLLAEILWAFVKGDYNRVATLHQQAGYIPAHVSLPLFAQACRAIGAQIIGKSVNEISVGRLLGQLLRIAENFEMETQPQLLLLQKTMMTAEGVGRGLNPTINMWQVTEPLIKAWAREHLSPRARIKSSLRDAAEVLRDTPRMLLHTKAYLEKIQLEGITLSSQSLAAMQAQRTAQHRDWLRLGYAAIALLALSVAGLWLG
jgi:ubiquinone biosynthesis protein